MDSHLLLEYMESLRYERKISQDHYLENVISQRQYYRYRSKESEIPFEVLNGLAQKLHIPLLNLMKQYDSYVVKEKEEVTKFFQLVQTRDFDKAYSLREKIDHHRFVKQEDEYFYYAARNMLDFYLGKLSKVEFGARLADLVHLEDVLKQRIVTSNEMYILGLIMEYNDKNRERVFEKFVELKDNNALLLEGNDHFMLQVLFWIAKNYGRKDLYEETIEYCDIAIRYSYSKNLTYMLELFYYYKALSQYRLKRMKEFEETLYHSLLIAFEIQEDTRRERFFEILYKDLRIDGNDFLVNQLMNKHKKTH